jgi:hypothetical protein
MYCMFCVVLCIICMYTCTVLLPPGGYPIAVNKYININIKIHPLCMMDSKNRNKCSQTKQMCDKGVSLPSNTTVFDFIFAFYSSNMFRSSIWPSSGFRLYYTTVHILYYYCLWLYIITVELLYSYWNTQLLF